jgi:hypothetical protein
MQYSIENRVNEIIISRIHKIPNSSLIQYTDTYTWLENPGENFLSGFKKNYPAEYQEEFNCIFDELHPF